jgi:hypothetical protein
MSQYYGHRPTNNWGEGDLPCPWCPGDIVEIPDGAYCLTGDDDHEPRVDHGPGMYVVTTAFSIDDGDAWYMRVSRGIRVPWGPDGETVPDSSDRLHVAYTGRCTESWDGRWCDWMAGVRLVDTVDPDGLATRTSMLADGWTMKPEWPSFLEPVGWAVREPDTDSWDLVTTRPGPGPIRRRVFLYR